MKYSILLLSVIGVCNNVYSQSLTNHTINTGFLSADDGNNTLISSIGEGGPIQYLKQTNIHLTQGYLQVEDKTSVSLVNANKEAKIIVFPNPVQGIANIDVTDLLFGNIYISLVDMAGKMIMSQTNQRPKGSNEIYQLNTEGIANGAYLLKIESQEEAGKVYSLQIRIGQ